MKLEAILEILLEGALGTIRQHMTMAPKTRYRAEMLSNIGKVLLEIERTHKLAPALPARTRALLLMPKRPIEDAADADAVRAYVRDVALGEPASVLAERVQRTHSAELMHRFLRYVPGVESTEIRATIAVANVMLS